MYNKKDKINNLNTEFNNLPNIFINKINYCNKLIPLSKTINSLGETRHFPAATKE
jgi:hypothetical protein